MQSYRISGFPSNFVIQLENLPELSRVLTIRVVPYFYFNKLLFLRSSWKHMSVDDMGSDKLWHKLIKLRMGSSLLSCTHFVAAAFLQRGLNQPFGSLLSFPLTSRNGHTVAHLVCTTLICVSRAIAKELKNNILRTNRQLDWMIRLVSHAKQPCTNLVKHNPVYDFLVNAIQLLFPFSSHPLWK